MHQPVAHLNLGADIDFLTTQTHHNGITRASWIIVNEPYVLIPLSQSQTRALHLVVSVFILGFAFDDLLLCLGSHIALRASKALFLRMERINDVVNSLFFFCEIRIVSRAYFSSICFFSDPKKVECLEAGRGDR